MAGLGPIALISRKVIANTDKKINVFFIISSPFLIALRKTICSLDYIPAYRRQGIKRMITQIVHSFLLFDLSGPCSPPLVPSVPSLGRSFCHDI
jgi:hypothetical protein